MQPVLLELDRDMEEAAASLGAGPLTTFRRIIFPEPEAGAACAGTALAFARAIGEFGSVILISGNLPKTQVASLFIFAQIESGNTEGAAAVSVTLLVIALVMLAGDRPAYALEPSPWPLGGTSVDTDCGSSRSATWRCCS